MTDPDYYCGSDDRDLAMRDDVEPCVYCDGEGIVCYVSGQHPDGNEVQCPKCEGTGWQEVVR